MLHAPMISQHHPRRTIDPEMRPAQANRHMDKAQRSAQNRPQGRIVFQGTNNRAQFPSQSYRAMRFARGLHIPINPPMHMPPHRQGSPMASKAPIPTTLPRQNDNVQLTTPSPSPRQQRQDRQRPLMKRWCENIAAALCSTDGARCFQLETMLRSQPSGLAP